MDFSEDDPWKKDDPDPDPDPDASDLLNFCSRAQTLISQLLLLSNRIPPEFRDRRYDPVLFDLRYFDSPEDFEARIEGDAGLEELEDQLRESCAEFMERFFLLANGVVLYHQELFKYLNDLQEGVHVRNMLEKLMENENGKQLLTESLVLFGCLLLLLEHCMGGTLREKLLVAHVRHDRCFDAPNLDKICLLCRAHLSTSVPVGQGHLSSMVLIQKPDELFASFPFPKLVVDTIICRLRDDDLYNQLRHYPDPEHRPVALGAQGGCLYIMLFFSLDFFHNGFVMREVVDRFFKNCWVIPIFMHFTVDLSFSWDAYKVAKTSLLSSLSPPFIRDLSQFHCNKVKDFLLELDSLLLDGIITRDYVLSNSQSLLSLVRNCNVSLHWLVLHRSSIDKKLREIVISAGAIHQVEEEMLLSLLLKTSQLEFVLKQLYIELLEGKAALWLESRNIASNCMLELSEYYDGSQALLWKVKDASLKDWFLKLSEEVCSLDHMKTGTAGRKLYNVISALREIESFQQVEENLQIKRRLFGIQKHLQDMLKALSLHNDTLFTFSVITDAVYAWEFVGCFDHILFKMIEKDLSMMLNLHSFFLKFRSMLDKPFVRVSQNHRYQPPPDYKEYKKEPLAEISVTDSTELWLMQWPLNQLQPDEFEGKELSLNLHHDGTLGTFESLSGKSYDLVSFAAHKPDATVILASASESKVVGKFSRRVCLVHYPEPARVDERRVKSRQGLSGSLRGNSDQFATPLRSLTKCSRSTSSRMHSSQQKSSVISKTSSIRGEPSQRKRVASPTPSEETMRSMDRSTRDSGRAGQSSVSSLGYSEDDHSQGRKSKKKHKAGE